VSVGKAILYRERFEHADVSRTSYTSTTARHSHLASDGFKRRSARYSAPLPTRSLRAVSRKLTPEIAQQLDLLLTQDRSTQLLMDKTLGSSNVVNSNNIEPLIEDMKRTLTESIEADAATSISSVKKDAATRVRSANERTKAAEQENATLAQSLAQTAVDDARIVDSLLEEVNRQMRNRRLFAWAAATVVVLLIGVLPLLTEKLSNESKLVCLVIAGVIASAFAYLQLSDRPVGIESKIMSWGRSRLKRLAEMRGIESKLEKIQIEQFGKLLRRSVSLSLD
jgi:hypothetical protein